MELREGESGETVTVTMTAPPRILCLSRNFNVSENCVIRVYHTVEESSTGRFCPGGMKLQQVVTSLEKEDATLVTQACDIKYTNTNWMNRYNIKVKASSDNIIDGDATAQLKLFVDYESTFEQQTDAIQTIDVSGYCLIATQLRLELYVVLCNKFCCSIDLNSNA